MENKFESVDELRQALIDQGYDESILFESPDYVGAVIGVSESGRVIYSYERMIEDLMSLDGMTVEDAVEFIGYNTIPALPYMGSLAPIVMYGLG